jgi:hypothetical protein
VQEISKKCAVAAVVVIGVALTGCSKKENYGADTSAVDTTTAMTASSTAPAMQDTARTATSTTQSTTKTSTAKKAPKKPTY